MKLIKRFPVTLWTVAIILSMFMLMAWVMLPVDVFGGNVKWHNFWQPIVGLIWILTPITLIIDWFNS